MSREETVRAFEGYYDEYADAIFRHCLFRTSDRERARELTQETFMRTWEYVARGNEIHNARAFLYKVASNLVTNEVARRRKHISLEVLRETYGFDVPDPVDSIPGAAVDGGLLIAKLSELKESHRIVLTYRYVDNLSVSEIATLLGKSQNTVSVRIHRALKELKKRVDAVETEVSIG